MAQKQCRVTGCESLLTCFGSAVGCLRKSPQPSPPQKGMEAGLEDILLVLGWTWLLALSVSRVKAPCSSLIWGARLGRILLVSDRELCAEFGEKDHSLEGFFPAHIAPSHLPVREAGAKASPLHPERVQNSPETHSQDVAEPGLPWGRAEAGPFLVSGVWGGWEP